MARVPGRAEISRQQRRRARWIDNADYRLAPIEVASLPGRTQ
jgi:hypothetical protein